MELFPRSILSKIPNKGSFLLYGISQSGKTTLAEYIFRSRNMEYCICKSIDELLNTKHRAVIVDIYEYKIDITKVPMYIMGLKDIIFISHSYMDLGIPSFRVHPLNFEEFLLFQNNSELVEHNFNKYMRFGGFPLLAKLGEGIEKEFPRLFYYVLEEFDIDILKYFATYSGHSRSIFTAYDALKKRRRISKDKLYRNFNLLIDNGYIICITEHQKMRNKRYYLMDHSFQGFFSEKSNIFVRFENMIVAELWKRNITNVAYYKSIPFYFHDEKKAIIPAPFMEIEKLKANIIKLISSLQEIELRRIEAVTIGVDETFRYGNIEIEAISFWKWAILL